MIAEIRRFRKWGRTDSLFCGKATAVVVSPVSGPWLLMKTLRSGYLTSCGVEDGCLRIAIDDSYEDDALHLDVWLDESDCPKRGEILWKGRRILTVEIENFVFL